MIKNYLRFFRPALLLALIFSASLAQAQLDFAVTYNCSVVRVDQNLREQGSPIIEFSVGPENDSHILKKFRIEQKIYGVVVSLIGARSTTHFPQGIYLKSYRSEDSNDAGTRLGGTILHGALDPVWALDVFDQEVGIRVKCFIRK